MRDSSAERALEALVRERGPALVRYATLFTGDPTAAQDLVQDAIVKVFVRTRTGVEVQALEGYVRRTIATLYVDGHRKRVTFRRVHHLVAAPDRTAAPDSATADRLDLRSALRTLSPQERTAVVLRFYEDMSVAEAADAMGLALGTVKRYQSNAIAKLERHLGPMPALHTDDALVVVADHRRS